MIGLRRGEVILCDHQKEWELYAEALIKTLREILGDAAVDIQHIGSTAVRHIKAKPLIDIAVAVHDFESLAPFFPALENVGVYTARNQPLPGIVLCAVKNHRESDLSLGVVHIVLAGSPQWHNHIDFRDYLIHFPERAGSTRR